MPFVKGKSGNPRGRPVGARGKETLAREAGPRTEAEAKASRMAWRALGGRGRRALLGPGLAKAPKQPQPAPVLAATAVQNAVDAAAELAALLGVDMRCVIAAVGLTEGGKADARADTADERLLIVADAC
jgi:hypothetical protein